MTNRQIELINALKKYGFLSIYCNRHGEYLMYGDNRYELHIYTNSKSRPTWILRVSYIEESDDMAEYSGYYEFIETYLPNTLREVLIYYIDIL